MGIVPWYMKAVHVLPPDLAHSLSRYAVSLPPPKPLSNPKLEVDIMDGLRLPNPIGLAAGYDKDGDLYRAFSRWGMGFYVVGSVTLKPRKPLPRPRLYRPHGGLKLLNALGLPSKGIARISGRLHRTIARTTLFLSLAGFSLDEFRMMLEVASRIPAVSAIELNMSCPLFEDPAGAEELVKLAGRGWGKPVLVKLSPRHDVILEEISWAADRNGVGLVIYNTIPVRTRLLGAGHGGMSGLPLYGLTLAAIRRARRISERIPIVAVGGFLTGGQVLDVVEVGANAVEALTAVAFRGPLAFRKIVKELLEELKRRGYRSVEEARGYKSRSRRPLELPPMLDRAHK